MKFLRTTAALAIATILPMPLHADGLETVFGGVGKDGIRKMIKTSDGGYAVAGWQDQKGVHESGTGVVAKINSVGDVEWQTTVSTSGRNQAATLLQRARSQLCRCVRRIPNSR